MKIENKPWSWGVLAGLAVLLLGIVATCTSCAASRWPSLDNKAGAAPRTPQEQLAATYYVSTTCALIDGSGTLQGGSGVMVDAHHVLTALHVVKCKNGGIPIVRVAREDGPWKPAVIQRAWKTKDIAVLYVRLELPGADAKLGGLPRVGDAVCAHTAAPNFGATCGEVTGIRPERADMDVEIAQRIWYGNSGSGVYLDGVLIGIITHLLPCVPNTEESCGGYFSSIGGVL